MRISHHCIGDQSSDILILDLLLVSVDGRCLGTKDACKQSPVFALFLHLLTCCKHDACGRPGNEEQVDLNSVTQVHHHLQHTKRILAHARGVVLLAERNSNDLAEGDYVEGSIPGASQQNTLIQQESFML